MNFTVETDMFSIHPLVHSWTRSTLVNREFYTYWMVAILGMGIASIQRAENQAAALWLVPHIDSLLRGQVDAAPDFNTEYARTYGYAGRLKKAEQLEIAAIEKHKKALGEDHPDTIMLLMHLAVTYHRLFQLKRQRSFSLLLWRSRSKAWEWSIEIL
jgi:hypothetical protein